MTQCYLCRWNKDCRDYGKKFSCHSFIYLKHIQDALVEVSNEAELRVRNGGTLRCTVKEVPKTLGEGITKS